MEIVSREEARERGLTHFFTGQPCIHGHIAERYVSDYKCVCCKAIQGENRKEYFIQYGTKNKDKARIRSERYYAKNKAEKAARQKLYYQENKEKNRAKRAAYMVEWRKSSPAVIFSQRIRAMIGGAIRRRGFSKNSKTAEILGGTWDEFNAQIEKQFLPGMSWENRHLWHIDHIVPMATATTAEHAAALNHMANLRPIWADDNLKKKAKILFLI